MKDNDENTMSFTSDEFNDCFGDDIRLATWARNHVLPHLKIDWDCGDNSCFYALKKGGMRTNGGCRCDRDVRHPHIKKAFRQIWKSFKERKPLEDDET